MTAAEISPVLTKIVDTLVAAAQPEKIVLFGSYADGTAGADSDLDLLVVWNRGAGMRHVDRCVRLRKMLDKIRSVPMDILSYTEDEIERIPADPRTFTALILAQGTVVYDQRNAA